MKKFFIIWLTAFLIVIGSGCIIYLIATKVLPQDSPAVKVTTIVIYDTIPDYGRLNRDKYKLPEPYKLFYDSSGKGWVATYHFDDLDKDVYLSKVASNFVTVFFGIHYADHMGKPGEAVALIKEHYREVLADRAKH